MPHRIQSLAAPLLPQLAAPTPSHLRRILALWTVRLRSRRALTRLTALQLQDIGLTAPTAQAECQKPFWRD